MICICQKFAFFSTEFFMVIFLEILFVGVVTVVVLAQDVLIEIYLNILPGFKFCCLRNNLTHYQSI